LSVINSKVVTCPVLPAELYNEFEIKLINYELRSLNLVAKFISKV
jgi:hypothetical protein